MHGVNYAMYIKSSLDIETKTFQCIFVHFINLKDFDLSRTNLNTTENCTMFVTFFQQKIILLDCIITLSLPIYENLMAGIRFRDALNQIIAFDLLNSSASIIARQIEKQMVHA